MKKENETKGLFDEFEGEAYERVLTKVKLKNGSTVDGYIYRLRAC